MVNLEEIRGEHKKLYKTPDMEIVYLTWADIVTSSSGEPGEIVDPNRPPSSDDDNYDPDDPFG